MGFYNNLVIIFWLVICCGHLSRSTFQPVCMDGKLHKTQPSPNELFQQCALWKDFSCCTNETAFAGHSTFHKLYNFNYSHCGNMTQKCMNHFTQNNCFYECSPYLGPWIVKTTSSFRREKIEGLPLCSSDCTNWWNDCKEEKTCVINWAKDFEFSSKGNYCPDDSNCQTFLEVYNNATFFCQNIFKGDFRVESDDQPCMKLRFDEGENPNKAVAEHYHDIKQASTTTIAPTESSVQGVCMDGKLHKIKPTQEELYDQCAPWRNSACCTNETAFAGHSTFHTLYNLNYSHCENMSQKCMRHFTQNNCFYECSPNLGPWIVKTTSSFRNDKIEGLPLCSSDCTNWWNDCKDEKTCVINWAKDFEFTSKGNHCPADSNCRTFLEVYNNATFFCQNIFKEDFRVESDDQPCMKLWFDEGTNPNEAVANYYATHKTSSAAPEISPAPTTAGTTTTTDSSEPKKERIPFENKSTLSKTGTVITVLFASLFIIITVGCIGYHLYYRFYKSSGRRGPQHCRFLRCFVGGPNVYHRTGSDDRAFIDYDDEVIDDDDDLNPHGTLQMEL